MKKTALIIGVNGQDGSYLSRLLLNKNYLVYGSVTNLFRSDLSRLKILNVITNSFFKLLEVDITSNTSIHKVVNEIDPDEIYNLAGQSSVFLSAELPYQTFNVNLIGVLNILECLKQSKKNIKFFQASSCEIFDNVECIPQNENSKFLSKNLYGQSKLSSHNLVKLYRENYNLYCSSGILYNHESPLRGANFFTKKVTTGFHSIVNKELNFLRLGNINPVKDWGFVEDFVFGFWKILQHDTPDDFILSTNTAYSCRDMIIHIGKFFNFNLESEISGDKELLFDKVSGKVIIESCLESIHNDDHGIYQGDFFKAKNILNWEPKVNFEKLCEILAKNKI